VINRMLMKDPAKRIALNELRNDSWVTMAGKYPLENRNDATIQINLVDKLNSITNLQCITHLK